MSLVSAVVHATWQNDQPNADHFDLKDTFRQPQVFHQVPGIIAAICCGWAGVMEAEGS